MDKKEATYTVIDLTKNEDVRCIDMELSTIIYFDLNGKIRYDIRYKGCEQIG